MQWEWDKALDEVFPGVTQSYFDCSVNSHNVSQSIVFSYSYFGGSVELDPSTDGPAPNGQNTGMFTRIDSPQAVTRSSNNCIDLGD
jgi:hypothetical protein